MNECRYNVQKNYSKIMTILSAQGQINKLLTTQFSIIHFSSWTLLVIIVTENNKINIITGC